MFQLVQGVRQGAVVRTLKTNQWPQPPRWIDRLHPLFPGLPVRLSVAVWLRLRAPGWPRRVAVWTLHSLLDIPSHSRRKWAPQFLWPLSTLTVADVAWAEELLIFCPAEMGAADGVA